MSEWLAIILIPKMELSVDFVTHKNTSMKVRMRFALRHTFGIGGGG